MSEPATPPASSAVTGANLETAAGALAELLSALARRQHGHREHSVARITPIP
ncbi:hypothetical protein ACFYNY_24175 [Streptomyces sp. NPDC006530]|uniref:hypothetical protein n=1 Tax=Streptomyces sp. NPDC006530 TaxID=3364750 RepID=UPI0036839A5E